MGEAPDAERPVTRLLNGALLLRQAATGHRVGTDAVLLAAATRPHPGDTVIDVGSGVGAVGLAVARRHPTVAVRLIEVMPELAALARDNAALNGLDHRVIVEARDIFDCGGPEGQAQWVVSNPPYETAGSGRPSPDLLRARAHTMAAQTRPGLSHGDWLRAMLRNAAPHAALVLIHRPDALPALLEGATGRLGQLRVLAIHAREGGPAIRILFGGIVGSRAPFGIVAPLVLHEADGSFTPRATRLHRGEDTLDVLDMRRSRPRRPAFA